MAAKLSTPTPTWVYTWYEYGWAAHRVPGVTPPFVLNHSDMVTSYKRVAEQGAAGAVMWGSSNLLMASRGAGRAAPLRAGGPQAPLPECNTQLAEYVRSAISMSTYPHSFKAISRPFFPVFSPFFRRSPHLAAKIQETGTKTRKNG
eukprot:COSAG04_NODE_13305_length_612_cov_0.799220_1_plen_145_part_01